MQEEKRAGLSFDALRFAQLIKQWTTEAINLINDVVCVLRCCSEVKCNWNRAGNSIRLVDLTWLINYVKWKYQVSKKLVLIHDGWRMSVFISHGTYLFIARFFPIDYVGAKSTKCSKLFFALFKTRCRCTREWNLE